MEYLATSAHPHSATIASSLSARNALNAPWHVSKKQEIIGNYLAVVSQSIATRDSLKTLTVEKN